MTFFIIKTIDFSLKKYTRHNNVIHVPSLVGLDLKTTQDTLLAMGLDFTIIDSAAYNPNYRRGDVLSHQPKFGSEVKPGRKIYLTINPVTIHYMPLPDLANKSLRQAISLLTNSAFLVGDLNYVDHYAQNLVRSVKINNNNVSPNDSFPKFTTVDLYLGDGYNDDVVVPDLIGLRLNQVKHKLNNHSLNLGQCHIMDSVRDTTLSIINKQMPLANERVSLGSYISVWSADSLLE